MLAILGVLSPRRRPSIQLAGGAAVVLIALLAAALPGVAKSAMLDWKTWGKPQKEGESVGFIWNHTYAGLKRPRKPVTLLRITSDHPAYWKAVVLGTFDGVKWVADPNTVDTAPPPKIVTPQDQLSPAARGVKLQRSEVKVQNINLATRDLVGPAEIVSYAGVADEAGTIDHPERTVRVALVVSIETKAASPSRPALASHRPMGRTSSAESANGTRRMVALTSPERASMPESACAPSASSSRRRHSRRANATAKPS